MGLWFGITATVLTFEDSVNEKLLLDPSPYAPGQELPAHLSPFVNDQEEGYVPERRAQLDQVKGNLQVGNMTAEISQAKPKPTELDVSG
jgi:hypothetical protein